MNKGGTEHWLRGSRVSPSERERNVRYAGIDIAAEDHFVAVVSEHGEVIHRATKFGENAAGYGKLFELLGTPDQVLVAMEATGHYWKNLFAVLVSRGFSVAVVNPLRTRRYSEGDLERTKTDAIDAMGIACFAQEKRPVPTKLPDSATEELKELVRLRDRLVDDLTSRVRELHRVVDLSFPEFTTILSDLATERAISLLEKYPSAKAFREARRKDISNLRYGNYRVGLELADELLAAAQKSVGQHHAEVYRTEAKYFCADIRELKSRLRELDRKIDDHVESHPVAKLLTSIDGIGNNTAGRIVATFGDLKAFDGGGALASYVGVIPATNHSGKRRPARAGISPIGNADLRTALYMPTLAAVRLNPWLKAFYERLRKAGKPAKVALIAAMRKLLHAIYSVAKSGKPFVPRLREINS
jgi:transposase